MVSARKGDPIVCSRGHVNGHVLADLADTDTIRVDDEFFDLDSAAKTITEEGDGHVCSQCGERVTRLRDGLYRIRTSHGWLGRVA